jgi:signal peptidase II
MRKYLKVSIIILLVFTLLGCDQATKSFAKHQLQYSASVNLLGGFVRFQYAENQGYFLSIGSTLSESLRNLTTILLTVIVLIGLSIMLILAKTIKLPALIAFSLFIAGSLGNLIDRILNQGGVVDFLILGTKTLHTGILNAADLFITASIVILIVLKYFFKHAD